MNVQNMLSEEPKKTAYSYLTRWYNIVGDYFPWIPLIISRLLGWILTTYLLRPYNEKVWASNQGVCYKKLIKNYPNLLAYFTRDATIDNNIMKLLFNINAILSPVEGTIVDNGVISNDNTAAVLNGKFNINKMLDEDIFNNNFNEYPYTVIFLSPTDIHNVYFPYLKGTVLDIKFIYGKYLLTNPYAIQYSSKVYQKNYRASFKFKLDNDIIVWICMISANLVGVIQSPLKIGDKVKFGDKVGNFLLGSTVVLITNDKSIKWQRKRGDKLDIMTPLNY
mmetsp:Transcript_16586/g.20341  ORF Transcript_16586/g.20341 Transcript_16586/m.20341 type:complete len:278 (-) Transcript_16586:183-1016(-)